MGIMRRNRSWLSWRPDSWAYRLALAAALAGAPSARAGTIWMTLEWQEKNGLLGGEGASATAPVPTPGDLEQAARSFQGGDFDTCLKQLGRAVRRIPSCPRRRPCSPSWRPGRIRWR